MPEARGGGRVRLLHLYGERRKERRFRPPLPLSSPHPPPALPGARAQQRRLPWGLPLLPRRPGWGSAGAGLGPAVPWSLRGDERCLSREPPAGPWSGALAVSLSPKSSVLGFFPWLHRDRYRGCNVQLKPNSFYINLVIWRISYR